MSLSCSTSKLLILYFGFHYIDGSFYLEYLKMLRNVRKIPKYMLIKSETQVKYFVVVFPSFIFCYYINNNKYNLIKKSPCSSQWPTFTTCFVWNFLLWNSRLILCVYSMHEMKYEQLCECWTLNVFFAFEILFIDIKNVCSQIIFTVNINEKYLIGFRLSCCFSSSFILISFIFLYN